MQIAEQQKQKQRHRGVWLKDRADRGLFQRGHVWYIRFKDQTGKMQREAVGPSKALALKAVQKRRMEVAEGRFFPEAVQRGISFESIALDALNQTKDRHSMKYGDSRRFHDSRYAIIIKWFPNRTAGSITAAEIEAKMNEYCKTPATFNQYRVAFTKIFKLAMKAKKVATNPARDIQQIKLDNKRVRYLEQDEEFRIRSAFRKLCPEHEPEFDLAMQTGLRFSEQYRAKWEHVDFVHRRLTVPLAKGGKTQHVVLNKTAIAALNTLQARTKASGKVCGDGTEWDHRQWWGDVLVEARVRDLRWHDLRHTFASRLVMKDVNILTVQKLMRHETLSETLRYAHLAPSFLDEAVTKLDPA
jgi:integrase